METESARELPSDGLARALGWFSVALGTVEVVAPAAMARLIGAPVDSKMVAVVRAMGAREVSHGIAIFTRPGDAAPVWSRVAGDAADLAFLGAVRGSEGAVWRRLAVATAAVAGVTALDVLCAQRLSSRAASRRHPIPAHVMQSITVNRPIEQVFAFWRHLENLPRFMRYVESVERLGNGTSRWRAIGPGGVKVEWLTETVTERENDLIAWRSLADAPVQTTGTVRFTRAPGARGTEVHVDMMFQPPAGSLGKAIGWLTSRDPARQLHEDLQRFKQLLETGEIAVSEGAGLWRPGRPTGKGDRVKTLAGVL